LIEYEVSHAVNYQFVFVHFCILDYMHMGS
jgi:hypothetical protein